jgi:RNA polymerase sigma-70 factor (ECF subfamily)
MVQQLDELMLVGRVVVGDDAAFATLVERYQSPLRKFFLNMTLGNASLSDDLAQDTFLRAYQYIRSFRGSAKFSTWLFSIGRNVYYDHLKSRRAETEHKAAEPEPVQPRGGEHIDLYRALESLRPEERMAITLYYFEGYSQDKVAAAMETPLNTVKTHLSRAKAKIYKYLEQ